ncbi:MAG: carboxypeptidase-like regulatory domain-containing protein, partial [Acidobacteriota bacterium]|nr:carboxypeptidase-like regulatory domain-containing protein [Acidobacteriota bacterium]
MRRRVNFFVISLALLSSEAFAQVTGGMLQGTATDSAGAVIPNVQISILNLATGVTREVATNSEGFYSAPNLAAGPYQIKA